MVLALKKILIIIIPMLICSCFFSGNSSKNSFIDNLLNSSDYNIKASDENPPIILNPTHYDTNFLKDSYEAYEYPDNYPVYDSEADNPYYPPAAPNENNYLYDGYYVDYGVAPVQPQTPTNNYVYPTYDPEADNEFYPPASDNSTFDEPMFDTPMFTN